MYNSVISLIKETMTVNEYGDQVPEVRETQVFAELKSIGQSEFYQAQAVGLKPEIKFVIADYLDYDDEQKIAYIPYGKEEAEVFSVIRTYRSGNQLEIVCKRGVEK